MIPIYLVGRRGKFKDKGSFEIVPDNLAFAVSAYNGFCYAWKFASQFIYYCHKKGEKLDIDLSLSRHYREPISYMGGAPHDIMGDC